MKKIETQNMCMERYFEKADEQKKRFKEFKELETGRLEEDLMKLSANEIL